MSLKEFAEKSLLKPWDVFIILLLTVLSFLPVMIFGLQQNTATAEKEAVLRVDGTEIKTFPLMAGEESNTYTYKDEDCDDQICVRRGWATKNGETIVCLPHKLVIEVRSTDGGDEDSLIY